MAISCCNGCAFLFLCVIKPILNFFCGICSHTYLYSRGYHTRAKHSSFECSNALRYWACAAVTRQGYSGNVNSSRRNGSASVYSPARPCGQLVSAY